MLVILFNNDHSIISKKYLANLKMRKVTNEEVDYKNSINTLRTQIDVIDQGLLDTLGKRMKV